MITKTCEACKQLVPEGIALVPTKFGPVCEFCLDLIEAELVLLRVLLELRT